MAWLGISYILWPFVIVLELIGLLFNVDSFILASCGFGFAIAVSLYAFLNGSTITVNRIEVQGPPNLRGRSMVQLSDVHIGSRKPAFLDKVVRKVQNLRPSYFVITGDLVDSSTVTAAHLKSLETVETPKFFTIGNHERYEDCEQIVEWMRNLGFRVLRNESVIHEGVQFIGIDDTENPEAFKRNMDHIDIAKDVYRVLLYHRPSEYQYAASKGIDLMVTGHTHHGQVFPFTLIVKRFFKYTRGTHRIGNMLLHVSTGTGTWGPKLRFGSNNEVTQYVFT